MLQEFRSDLKLQALVLGILGVTLLIVASFIQVPAWLGARYQRNVQSRSVVLRLDCNTVSAYQKSFQPTEFLIGNPQLRMRGPLLSEFQKTHMSGANVPHLVVQDFFSDSAIDFSVSWKISDGGNTLDSGVFCPSDFVAWSFPDHVYYKAEDYSGYRHVDVDKEYLLLVEVNKPCEALHEFKPVFILGPAPTKNLVAISRYSLKFTLPLILLGLVLLIVAASKRVFSIRETDGPNSVA